MPIKRQPKSRPRELAEAAGLQETQATLSPYGAVSPSPEIVLGFHGTGIAAAGNILRTQEWRLSDKPGDWLGRGVYFWRNPIKADRWANKYHSKAPIVLVAKIRLGIHLKLVDATALLAMAYADYVADMERLSLPLPVNHEHSHELDCSVLSFAIAHRAPTVQTIVYAFDDAPAFANSHFRRKEAQLCVRDPSCIIEVAEYSPEMSMHAF